MKATVVLFALGVLLFAAVGCGGGSSGSPIATSMPTPTATPVPTATPTPSPAGNPLVTLSATSLAFGNQALQMTSPAQSILVTSSGTGPLALTSIAVSGTNSADFFQFNNCSASTGVLSAGATCFINVMFNPSTTSAESATLTITDNVPGSPQTVSLNGQGVGEAVTVTPTATTVEVNHRVPFVPSVAGLSATGVNWSATAGTISSAGLYTAPASVPSPNTVTVTATSQSNPSLSASATVTIVPAAVSVLVSPLSASVQAGSSEVVTAVVGDTSNTAVTWSVNGVANGNSTVGTIATNGVGSSVATYIAPSVLPSSNPVSITATSLADPTKSNSASITVTSGSGIVIASLDKTSLQPFNLLTITGAGFNPQAAVTVNFSDSTGYSVNVPPVSVGASSVVVSVPPYISVSTGDFAAGSVNIQVLQTLGGSTVTSNTLSGFQIPNLPTLLTQPGAVTFALLTAQAQSSEFLINYFSQIDPTNPLNTPEMNGALNALAAGLGPLIAQINDVVENPTHTFTLGVASGNTLTVGSSELAKADRMIVGMLSAQAAAGYVDAPAPDCPSLIGTTYIVDITSDGGSITPSPAGPYAIGCTPFAANTALSVTGGAAGVATAGAGLLFGAEATAMVSAAVSSELTYITTTLGFGLTAVGGVLGQGSTLAQELVQSGGEIINSYLQDAILSTIVSKIFGEQAGNLFDLVVNANELVHAFGNAPPYTGGPSKGPNSTLTVSPTGTGIGTIVSFPGGVVCGGPDSTSCVVPFPTGETVYLDGGPSLPILSGACSGTGACQLVMNANETVTASFNTTTTGLTGTWTGSWTWSGPGANGCTFDDGGSFSMTLTQTGTSFSGSTTGAGVQLRQDITCALLGTDPSDTGTASGTISGATLNLSFDLVGSVNVLNFTGTATLNNNTLTATFQRDTGGSGFFTLTKQ